MFSVATIFLVAFALNLQDASSQSSVYSSIFPSSTTSANASALNITTDSSTKTTSVTTDSSTPTTSVTTSTSGTSSETTNTTATTSPPSVTITQSTATPPSGEKKKTCALVSATLDKKKPENLQQFLERFYFNDTEKYTDVEIKNLTKEGDDISFDVRLNFSGTEYFEGVAVKLLQDTLEASNVKVKVKGVKLTKWEAADGECDKCSNAGGPFDIRRECTEVECSCKGVKTTDQSEDCDKYNCHSTESGAVSFMVSYLLVAMAIALSLSFYL